MTVSRMASLLVAAVWTQAVLAQQPPQLHVVPLKTTGRMVISARPGKLIIIQSTAKGEIEWRYNQSQMPDDQALKIPAEKKLVLTTTVPGSYDIMLVEWDERRIHDIVLIVGGTAPPTPPTDPPPVDPVDKLGFVALAKGEGSKLPAENRKYAIALAGNFEAVRTKLAAGGFKGADDANAELRDKNRAVLGDARVAWLPWFQAWQARADTMLKTNADYVQAYRETAIGLRGVK